MTTFVVDASVSAKWYVSEVHDEAAARLLRDGARLIAPSLLLNELTNTFASKVKRGQMTALDARASVVALRDIPVELDPADDLLPAAFDIAIRYDRSVYDALYVALAIREQCRLITADRRLYNALLANFPETLLWIEDIPSLS